MYNTRGNYGDCKQTQWELTGITRGRNYGTHREDKEESPDLRTAESRGTAQGKFIANDKGHAAQAKENSGR